MLSFNCDMFVCINKCVTFNLCMIKICKTVYNTVLQLQNFKAGLKASSGEEKISNSVYLYTYVSYLRLVKTAERNLVMAESFRTSQDGGRAPESNEKKKSMKPQDYARLYDIVMQVSAMTCCLA